MKTIKQIREEYESKTLDQVQIAPDELVLEGRENKSFKATKTVPSPSEMPAMLLFRRMAYRLYPNKQVVALYYSKAVDKYLSIPFGPDGNLNLSESTVYNTYDEMVVSEGAKWDIAKGALKGAAHGAIRGGAIGGAVAPGPGTVIGAGVGAVRGAYKGAKKASEKTVKESFNDKISAMRKERMDEGWRETISDIGKSMPGYADKEASKEAFKKGDYVGAIKSQGKALGKAALTGAAVALGLRGARALLPGAARVATRAAGGGIGSLAKKAADAISSKDPNAPMAKVGGYGSDASSSTKGQLVHDKAGPKTSSSWKSKPTVAENKISDLRKMINEDKQDMDLSINGRTVTLNTTMAKRILEVYDSVNTKNKKIVESMLNEDLESFKKLLNFSIKA